MGDPREQFAPAANPASSLGRVLGVPAAVFMGLGSIVGTGIFVTIGLGAAVAGASVLIAIVAAGVLAACNGLASAQLAAAHPVSGGAYEYAYRYLSPWPARVAGVTFVCAKTASAATAALGLGSYALALAETASAAARMALAVGAVLAVTLVVAGGMTRSNRMNIVIVSITLVSLLAFVVACIPTVDTAHLEFGDASVSDIARATALVFVAYTGYGRIATLGEEVKNPARTIPRAIVIALLATIVLYLAVSAAAIGRAGASELAAATRHTNAPLEAIAPTWVRPVLAVGAVTAMLGVLLNLVLGVSRVMLAMARRRDLPTGLAHVERGSPRRAVLVTGTAIAGLACIGKVATTWTISAVAVLFYYAVMNACALRQPPEQRRIPVAVPAVGLIACVGLAAWLVIRTTAT